MIVSLATQKQMFILKYGYEFIKMNEKLLNQKSKNLRSPVLKQVNVIITQLLQRLNAADVHGKRDREMRLYRSVPVSGKCIKRLLISASLFPHR